MDGLVQNYVSTLDVSSVAGRITAILARRQERALARDDVATAARFDAGLDTIYFASLLLMVENGTGETRAPAQVLAALDTIEDVVAELRSWVEESAP